MSKKAMTIEEALRWAYREELPKQGPALRRIGPAAPRSSMVGVTTLGTKIDTNGWGVIPFTVATDDPSPDAVKLVLAAESLDALEVVRPAGWNPIAEFGDLGPLGAAAVAKAFAAETVVRADGKRKFKAKMYDLMLRFAYRGDRDSWRIDEPPRLAPVCENGTPKWFRIEGRWVDRGRYADQNLGHWSEVEVSGFNSKSRRPYPDAYRKYTLEPDPHLAIVARMEWQVWRSAIDLLAEDVELETIALKPSALSQWPWEDATATARVLPSLVAMPGESPRRRAGRRPIRAAAA